MKFLSLYNLLSAYIPNDFKLHLIVKNGKTELTYKGELSEYNKKKELKELIKLYSKYAIVALGYSIYNEADTITVYLK